MPLIFEERADLSPNLSTEPLNSSMRVVGGREVMPEAPIRMGSSTVTSSVQRTFLPGYLESWGVDTILCSPSGLMNYC